MPQVAQQPLNSLAAVSNLERQIGSADWSRWTKNRYCFYDYVQYPPAGSTEIQLFSVPNGSPDANVTTIVKTLEQTNMSESRSFGRVNFIIKQIRTHIRVLPKCRQLTNISNQTSLISSQYTALMNVLNDLVCQGTLVINIGQKEYWDIPQPFITCPPGFGPRIIQHGENSGGLTQAVWFVQDPEPESVYQVKPEQLIEAGQTFSCKIAFDNANCPALTNLVNSATPKVEIGVLFDGFVLRPVQ